MTEDEELILEITEVDLGAKEITRHEKCYRHYTQILMQSRPKHLAMKKIILKNISLDRR